MLSLGSQDSVKTHFSRLNILTIYRMYIYRTVMLVKKTENNLPKLGTHHNYNTRHKHYPAIHPHNLEFFNKKPTAAGIRFLYHLPASIFEINNINKFKRSLKEFLLQKSIYSFQEFFEHTSR